MAMEFSKSTIQWSNGSPESIESAPDDWILLSWHIRAGICFSATCRIPIPPTAAPFWCIPGLFWGDNQHDSTGQYYPRFQKNLEHPEKFQSSFWEFHTHRMAQPIVAVHEGSTWWILEVEPHTTVDSQVLHASVGFEYRDGQPVLLASLPYAERPYQHVGHDYTMPVSSSWTPTKDCVINWKIRLLKVAGERSSILDVLQANYHSDFPASQRADRSACAAATRDALLHWHFHPQEKYFRYTVAFDRVGQQLAEAGGASLDRHEMGLGWVSGWVVFEPLLEWAIKNGDTEALQSVEQTWNHLLESGLVSPSGFWWTRYAPQRNANASIFDARFANGFDGNWMPDPTHLHLRTLGDAVLRACRILRRHGPNLSFAEELQKQVLSQAEAVSKIARKGWPLPMAVSALDGVPTGQAGTAGMIWISVWAELQAMGLWDDIALLEAGLDHYREAVLSGELFGAPEDVGECVTSEDVYIAINTFLDGYRVTKRPEDLETAIQAARWLYLWRKSFDHAMDPRTILGVYHLRSRGGDLASFKNNHLHIYGLDADRSLRDLARLTQDSRWAELADDHWEFSAQLTPLVDGQFNAYRGMVTEQFYFIDWSALGNSVYMHESDSRKSAYDVGPHYRNHGNFAGFSHAWCTALVLKSALDRQSLSVS
jgi:hypothetical protein